MKTKDCEICKKPVDVAFRVQVMKGKVWVFVCKACLPTCQRKLHYRYGGTWKG